MTAVAAKRTTAQDEAPQTKNRDGQKTDILERAKKAGIRLLKMVQDELKEEEEAEAPPPRKILKRKAAQAGNEDEAEEEPYTFFLFLELKTYLWVLRVFINIPVLS